VFLVRRSRPHFLFLLSLFTTLSPTFFSNQRSNPSISMAAHPTLPADPHLIHRVWLSDENSAKIAEEVKHSLILISDQDVALSDVLPGLQTTFPSLNLWTARYLGNGHYQDQGSEKWRQDMVHAGMITLRQISFKVSTDLSCLYALSKPVKIWIRILDLDYEMRGYQGLVAVTQPFGSLLDLDFNTILRSDLRWARVFIEVVDLSLIPPFCGLRCDARMVGFLMSRFGMSSMFPLEPWGCLPLFNNQYNLNLLVIVCHLVLLLPWRYQLRLYQFHH
jgi:hypothetical protein